MIYETKCLINGKTYVGKHQTRDVNDGYTGSGNLLKRAIAKHGAENFVTRVLYDFDVEWKMNVAEKILVCTDPDVSYNLCPGGEGGWGYVNVSLKERMQVVRRRNYEQTLANTQKLNGQRGARSAITKHGIGFGSTHEQRVEWGKRSSGTSGKRYKQRNHNPASHPKGPRGPYKRRQKFCL